MGKKNKSNKVNNSSNLNPGNLLGKAVETDDSVSETADVETPETETPTTPVETPETKAEETKAEAEETTEETTEDEETPGEDADVKLLKEASANGDSIAQLLLTLKETGNDISKPFENWKTLNAKASMAIKVNPFVDFDARLRVGGLEITEKLVGSKLTLKEYLEALAGQTSVPVASLAGRRISISFPKADEAGDPAVSNTPKDKKDGQTRERKAPSSHGEVIYHPEPGKEIHYSSLNNMATKLGYQYTSRKTATEAIERPCPASKWAGLNTEQRKALPVVNRIENKDGKLHVYPVNAK